MMYTTPTQINDSWREVLIYKSETPLTFDSLDRHHQSDEQGDKTILTTYVTEPYIYREFAPTAEDSYYYYWFIVKVVERETVNTNSEKIINLETALAESDAVAMALFEEAANQSAVNAEQDAAILGLYEMIGG